VIADSAFNPTKPVKIVVPFPPGGGTDALSRILAEKLTQIWKQQVIVENRAGAQGNVGTAYGAKAPPDGYTLVLAHQGAFTVNPHIYKDTGLIRSKISFRSHAEHNNLLFWWQHQV